MEVSNEEERDVSKHAGRCEDENFSLDNGCKVAKVFSVKKESNEKEDDESSFVVIFEEEGEWRSKGGKEQRELIVPMN